MWSIFVIKTIIIIMLLSLVETLELKSNEYYVDEVIDLLLNGRDIEFMGNGNIDAKGK